MAKKILNNLLNISMAFLVLFIFTVLLFFDDLKYPWKRIAFQENNLLILLSSLGIFILIYIMLLGLLDIKSNLNFKNPIPFIYILSILLFIFQVYYHYSYYNVVGYDITKVLNNSYNLANNNQLINQDKWYFEAWPNNIFILHIYSTLISVLQFFGSSNINFMLIILNCLLSSISGVLLFKTLQKLFSNTIIHWFGYFLYIVMILFSPHMTAIYTDALGMNLPIIILYLYITYYDKNTIIKIILLGILSAIAYSIKPQTFVIAIAIIVYELLLKDDKFANKIKFTVILLVSIFLSLQAISLQTSYIKKELNSEKRVGYLHYMKMGLNPKSIGLYSHEDFTESRKLPTNEERDKHNLSVIIDRFNKHTFSSFTEFMTKKTLINYNDGTFGWYFIAEDNRFKVTEKNNTQLSDITNSMYHHKKINYNNMHIEKHIYWLFVLFMIIISLFKTNDDTKNIKSILFINFIGIFIFLSLFESSPRYLFTNIPLFILLAMYGVNNVINFKNTINKK